MAQRQNEGVSLASFDTPLLKHTHEPYALDSDLPL